jgi:SAM-dependent methyltransferase
VGIGTAADGRLLPSLPAGKCTPTFRDPDGFVATIDERVFRIVRPEAFDTLSAWLESPTGAAFVRSDRVAKTTREDLPAHSEIRTILESLALARGFASWKVLEHERIFFQSFPNEWAPEMLHASAELTLELAERSLVDGFGLKDATPFNILFRGARPVFVDLLSFERRDPCDSIWLPYAQFIRTFLLPLASESLSLGTIQGIFLTTRDGLDPEQLHAALPFWKLLQPPYLSLVALPTWASRRGRERNDLYRPRRSSDPEQAQFILRTLLRGLRRQLHRVRPKPRRRSVWVDYEVTRSHYSPEQTNRKQEFVARVLEESRPLKVLDIGANAGEYSMIAARLGATVVAVDFDAAAVGEAWRRASAAGLDILPLVVNFGRPTPAVGWRNRECPSFLSRARGRFDAVMMLAVAHHLMVTERVPLQEILELASELTTDLLIIEFVAPEDPMFRHLARGRDELYAHLTLEHFEGQCGRYFEIVHRQPLDGSKRILFAMRRKG